jgi:hypothetical protein
MTTKMKVVGVGALVALLLGTSAGAASAKTILNLKVPGAKTPVADGTKLPAGWYVGFGEKFACQLLPLEEGESFKEEAMVLNINGTTKDKATGTVAAPPCFEVEEEEATGGVANAAKRKRISHRSAHQRIFSATETTISATGKLASQEIKTNHKGKMELSAPLVIKLETGALKCAYESKTKIAATWPPEENPEFPNIAKTADLGAEVTFKLDKALSAKTGCAKKEEGFVETWLGPLGEELEAELAS